MAQLPYPGRAAVRLTGFLDAEFAEDAEKTGISSGEHRVFYHRYIPNVKSIYSNCSNRRGSY
jgi:hypothetical protein